MSAKDDFELVRQACFIADAKDMGGSCHEIAFNCLFTPRPLRELFDAGFRFCWAWHPKAAKEPLYFDMRSNRSDDFVGTWAEMVAVPILRPEDMGITP